MVLESNTLDVLFVKDGQQGEDGKILYTWIKYAKDANGTGMTDDPNGAVYIGISYNNESSTESNDPTQYAWTKIQGADGKKGEDAYTIFLENENISFATDENRDPLSEQAYTSGITIMKGAKPVTEFTIGDIAKTQGIAVAKTDTAIAISVINGNPLPNDSGVIEIPISVGGTVFKKILSWTCSKKGDQGIQGIQGPQGVQGEKGKDGTSVTISNKSITYQLSTSGTVVPTGTWQTSPQTIPEGQYQWTKTSVTYSDGNKTESYSISYRGKNGSNGTSVKTTSTSVKYQVGDSGTTKPTGTWQTNVPTVAQGKYLWTQTIVNYSDGNSTESYSVSYRGIDGNNGVNGMNAATIYLYQRATSTPSKPSNVLTYTFSTTKITGTLNNGWSTAIPTGTDAVYVTVASVSSKNDTITIATSAWSAPVVLAQNGKTGSDGKAGLNVATIYLYQRNTSKPSKPSASVTYTFSTGVASGLNNGWSQKIPDGTNPLYVTLATASSNTATDTILSSEWSDVVVMAQNGEDGQDGISPKVSLSKSGNTTTISIVDATGTHTQTVKDGTNGTPGEAGKDGKTSYFHVKYSNDGGKTFTGNSGEDTGTYMGSYTDYTEADSTDVKKYTWVKVKGDKGDTGQKGQDGTSITITSKSVTYQASTSGTTAPTGTWSTSVPTVNNGQYLWTKTTVQYSDGNKTEAYSVSYKGTNGTNGTSVTVSKTEVTYQVSTSGTTAPTGTWSTTMPSCDQGLYLWTKTYVKYSDGKDTTSYAVSYKGVDGEKFAFNMLRETNQGSKHWENHASSGKYSTESIITEDGINAVKLICTEATPSSGWQYVSFDDYQMLKSLKPSTDYVISFDIKSNLGARGTWVSIQQGDSTNAMLPAAMTHIKGNETWEHIRVFLRSNDTLPKINGQYIYITSLGAVGYSIIKNLKLTEGTVDTPWAPHPEDLEGRGVSETVQYYLATSQASGVTSSTSGWSTDITTQKLTADKKYLWNCYQTKYSDGTSEPVSTPKVIGVYGDKGANALQCKRNWTGTYTTINGTAVATLSDFNRTPVAGDVFTALDGSSNTGTWQVISVSGSNVNIKLLSYVNSKGDNAKNLSITPSSQYFKSTDGGKTFAPNTITIKPTIQGEISFGKWQYSIDGGVSFADVVSGQKGLTISNNVLSVSKDSSLYSDAVTMVTFRAVANDSSFYDTCSIAKIYDVSDIQIGGRNLVLNSDKEYVMGYGIPNTTWTDGYAYIELPTTRLTDEILPQNNAFLLHPEAGKTYTQTIWIETDTDVIDLNAAKISWFTAKYGHVTVPAKIIKLADNSYKLTSTHTVSQDDADIRLFDIYHLFSAFNILNSGTYLKFGKLKVEQGNVSTDWTPAPEDVQTAILSTKSEISSVSSKVDQNTKSIENRVEKTTYERELTLVKGDISKANEGLNKWRYEIYPKSLFASEYQGKSTMDVFAKNTNLTPSQSVLINDTDFGKSWAYGDNYIGYALTFVKFSTAKSVAITFKHDDGAHLYLNGKLVGGDDTCNTGSGQSLTLSFIQGWNCLEVVLNEKSGGEYIGFGTTISAISECQLMNCYYGTPVARQSHITNQLVQNTTDIEGISGSVQRVMSTVGDSGNIDEFVNNYSTWKKKVNGIETRVGETYTTKDEFNGLEIGGRNLLRDADTMSTWIKGTKLAITYGQSDPDGGSKAIKIVNSEGTYGAAWIEPKERHTYFKSGQYTYSFYAKSDAASGSQIQTCITGNYTKVFDLTTTWKRYTYTITIANDLNTVDMYWFNFAGKSAIYFYHPQLEKGNKATDWTPAPEDDEINGQNLVSNLPSNWEQGSVSYVANSTYASIKSTLATRIRTKDVFSVSGNVTVSAGTSTNSSKEALNFYYVLFDINKKSISHSDTWQSLTSAKIINCGDAKYMAIILKWDSGTTTMNPSDISQICLKVEHGTSATPFTLAPEDVNGKIVNVETIANQTAKKFEWIVKGGDKSSSMVLTDDFLNIVANKINLTGKVTFNSFDKSTQDKLNSPTSGNLITVNPTNPTSNYGNTSFSVTGDDAGGRCIQSTASFVPFTNYASNIFKPGEQIYYNICVPNWSSTTFNANLGIWFFTAEKKCVANSCKRVTLTRTTWNKLSGYITVPSSGWSGIVYYVIGIENPNKYQLGLVSNSYIEKTSSYASTYAKGAVDWVTSNGSSTTNLNSMVKKWTDGAVSDTTQINGGWIKANTITASKIALADFTNYSQLTRDTADMYGFTVTDDTDGTWFSTKVIKRDLFISKLFPCNGGESYLIEYDISTNMKASNTASDTKNYRDTAIGVYGYTGDVNSNGEPTKATNIWYATRVTGSSGAPVTHIKTAITTSTTTKQFRIFLQSNGYYFEGTTKIRNLSVRRMYGGTLIVDGSITADKIATDAIKSRNYISSGGTQGSFLNLSDGSFTSPNLSWDSNGNLIATNANLSGQITATKGKIGLWTLDGMLYDYEGGLYSEIAGEKSSSVWAYDGNYTAYNFATCSYQQKTGFYFTIDASSLLSHRTAIKDNKYWSGACSLEAMGIIVSDSYYEGASVNNNASDESELGNLKSYTKYFSNNIEFVTTYSDYGTSSFEDLTIKSSIYQNYEALNIVSNSMLYFQPTRTSLFTTSDTSKYNAIESMGDVVVHGKIKALNELQTTASQMRIISGNIGCMLRNDSADFYILRTNSGDPYGGWTDDRPFRINWASNDITCGHNLMANDLIANSWLYCSEVHSSGAVVIGADSESFYWAHGFQIARGTSWGGVCIGDDSHQLRLYGSSIWASHSISTSDENLKENFTTLDQYEDFYMNLNPIGFNYIGDYDGKKTHFGFGAHKTEDILESEGYDSDKFAVVTHRPLVQEDIEKRFGKDVEVDIETEYGVSYTEFIALNTHMIQKTRKELTKVKQEKAALEARLQAIEAKLGL